MPRMRLSIAGLAMAWVMASQAFAAAQGPCSPTTLGLSGCPYITSISPTAVAVGSASFTLTVNGQQFTQNGTPKVIFNASIPLPVTFVSATQLRAGFSSSLLTCGGNYPIQVANGNGSSNIVTISIVGTCATVASLAISTTSIPGGTKGTAYSATLVATGGTTPYGWRLSSGALPPGLTLSANTSGGLISGTPTASGTYTFTALVQDSGGRTATSTYSVTIN